jgi:hypothetical protein
MKNVEPLGFVQNRNIVEDKIDNKQRSTTYTVKKVVVFP